jgi:hypothetical protein
VSGIFRGANGFTAGGSGFGNCRDLQRRLTRGTEEKFEIPSLFA